jgi:hypothetical protein
MACNCGISAVEFAEARYFIDFACVENVRILNMADIDPRILELEDGLKEAERRLAETRAERDEARELVQRMEEHVADADATIEQWKQAFDMELDDAGLWAFSDNLAKRYDSLLDEHNAIIRRWNKFVPKYNAAIAPKEIGRPLDASPAQCARVHKLRKAGTSLRAIADEMNLGLQTVRTILGRQTRTDRTSINRLQKYDPDNAVLNAAKARKRTRDVLPKRISEVLHQGGALLKEAKGLGR